MAKRKSGQPSKSDLIRNYFGEHPGAAPKEVSDSLKGQGVTVSLQLISNIKRTLGQTKRRGKPGRKRGRPVGSTAASRGTISVDVLIEAQKLVKRIGSVEEVRRALDALARLQ